MQAQNAELNRALTSAASAAPCRRRSAITASTSLLLCSSAAGARIKSALVPLDARALQLLDDPVARIVVTLHIVQSF